jgi:hypothetical protein
MGTLPLAVVLIAASPLFAQEANLDCFFDRACRAAEDVRKLPIRQEDKVLPKAPRYALDLSAVPPRFLDAVSGFEFLPHKNQEETPEFVDSINALIRAKNKTRGGRPLREWTYNGTPNEPPFACLSYAMSTVFDYWTLQCGGDLPSFKSMTHGGTEPGWDPRTFELEYFYRASTGDSRYALFSQQLPVERDPVRGIGSPYSPLGYAEMAVETKPFANPDPFTDQVHAFPAQKSPMEGRYVQLFSNRVLRGRTPDRYARELAEALHAWGIVYAQLENTDRPRMFGAHTIAVVGVFCMEMDGRYLKCADNKTDEDWGRTAWFVAHDSFGDFPASKERASDGGSAYRAVRIGSLDEAYAFPHTIKATAKPVDGKPGAWKITATNSCGRPVPMEREIVVTGAGLHEVEVPVRHYYESDGSARRFLFDLKDGEAAGSELVRTPPSETFYDRHPGAWR